MGLFPVNPGPGKFMVFEGLDGSGKSTQSEMLAESLSAGGLEVVLTHEPTNESSVSDEIRAVLAGKKTMSALQLQALFAQDRREHLETLIIPALQAGKAVISDRYFLSTFAFGGIDVALEKLFKLNKGFLMPDLTFLVETLPEVCLDRMRKARGKTAEFFETEAKMRRVWKCYQSLARVHFPDDIQVIDGEKNIAAVGQEMRRLVRCKLDL